jgi:hypothetical protein
MSDELNPAVLALQRKLDEQLQAAAETKKVINMLLKSMGKPPQYADVGESSGIIRADQFYGKQFATAASEYLELRKQACQPEDILRGLIEGGFDFDHLGWRENDRLRSLAISLAKNNVKFHRLKNGSFGLRTWYEAEFLDKTASKHRRGPVPKRRRGAAARAEEIVKTLPESKGKSSAKQKEPSGSRPDGSER